VRLSQVVTSKECRCTAALEEELIVTDNLLQILPADLDDSRVITLLESHVRAARAQTAPGSAHALDLSELKTPSISVWAAWLNGDLLGVGALKRLSGMEGEIKSMYTSPNARRRGVARSILAHIVAAARSEGIKRLSLETGSWRYFEPARALYAAFGFSECGPFGDYHEDPNSAFMTLDLTAPDVWT
jgi:putative acetyltransferase